jgi:hypothetical protein
MTQSGHHRTIGTSSSPVQTATMASPEPAGEVMKRRSSATIAALPLPVRPLRAEWHLKDADRNRGTTGHVSRDVYHRSSIVVGSRKLASSASRTS